MEKLLIEQYKINPGKISFNNLLNVRLCIYAVIIKNIVWR